MLDIGMNDTSGLTSDVAPRVYVACAAAYNAGKLHGVWLDATRGTEAMEEEAMQMLRASPVAYADTYAITDQSGFGRYRLREYTPLADVARLADLISIHGEIVTDYIACLGEDVSHAEAHFADDYQGVWESLTDYAYQLLDDLGDLDALPERLRRYIDVDSYARDLELAGDVWIIRKEGRVHVFSE